MRGDNGGMELPPTQKPRADNYMFDVSLRKCLIDVFITMNTASFLSVFSLKHTIISRARSRHLSMSAGHCVSLYMCV